MADTSAAAKVHNVEPQVSEAIVCLKQCFRRIGTVELEEEVEGGGGGRRGGEG